MSVELPTLNKQIQYNTIQNQCHTKVKKITGQAYLLLKLLPLVRLTPESLLQTAEFLLQLTAAFDKVSFTHFTLLDQLFSQSLLVSIADTALVS